jgi:hypothetical protein
MISYRDLETTDAAFAAYVKLRCEAEVNRAVIEMAALQVAYRTLQETVEAQGRRLKELEKEKKRA